MSTLPYQSPVALPIIDPAPDDYRIYRNNRKWMVSVLVNGKRYFVGFKKGWRGEGQQRVLSTEVMDVHGFDTYPQSRHEPAMHLTEPTGNGFEMRASSAVVKSVLGLDINPRVKIEIAMVETTPDSPAWRVEAYRIQAKPEHWHTQHWADL
jgi:hypothetical protein